MLYLSDRFAKRSSRAPRLGELLVGEGLISPDELADALDRQQRTGRRLGEELVCAGYARRAQVARMLRLQRRIAAVAMVSSLAAAALQPLRALAGQGSALLGVHAQVPPRAVMQVDYEPPTLELTASDVARGYIEVGRGSRLRVTSNSPTGFAIDVRPRLNIFASVTIHASGLDALVGPDGGTVVARGRRGRQIATDLSYRFTLPEHIAPGSYPWPLALSVRAL